VVENSTPENCLKIPQLVGLEDGTVLVNTFDWQAHLSPYFQKLPQIKSCQHFRYLLCRLPQSVFVNNKETCNILIVFFVLLLTALMPKYLVWSKLGLTVTQGLLAFSCCVTWKFYTLSSVFLLCLHLD
ncbi:hypothetical protein GOODEAATRI_033899, partial [Goodea atripinnis]